ncbi:unnamed protein product, partial [Discosporangium mesarthrocarpum]
MAHGIWESHACQALSSPQEQLLTVAVAVEELSDHPLAAAIVEGSKAKLGERAIPEAQNLEA